jgi:toxin-antitoxin system PIN domain toxin
VILDANVLLYAVDAASPQNERASHWLAQALNGDARVGFPWSTIGAFVRIATHPRVAERPLTVLEANRFVARWLAAPPAWVPAPSARTFAIFKALSEAHQVTGNLVPDAMLAAQAIEHGVPVVSTDGDFARFPECRWVHPLRG